MGLFSRNPFEVRDDLEEQVNLIKMYIVQNSDRWSTSEKREWLIKLRKKEKELQKHLDKMAKQYEAETRWF